MPQPFLEFSLNFLFCNFFLFFTFYGIAVKELVGEVHLLVLKLTKVIMIIIIKFEVDVITNIGKLERFQNKRFVHKSIRFHLHAVNILI